LKPKERKSDEGLANLRIRPSLKRKFDVEAAGRDMGLADFAEYVWQVYVDSRPDMVVQQEDGTVEIVPRQVTLPASSATVKVPELVDNQPLQGVFHLYPEQDIEWHDLLHLILQGDTPQAKEAIQRNLEMFALATTIVRSKTPEEVRGILDIFREGLDKLRESRKKKKAV
jgi:hypothetical protein